MKTLLPRRPGVLMLLPPLIPQRSDCSTKVVHCSNSLSMFNPSSFKCILVPRQCFNSGNPDADGCRMGPVEHFNDPRTLKSRASYGGRTHLNNHRHQFPGNVMRQRKKTCVPREQKKTGEEKEWKKCKRAQGRRIRWVSGNRQGDRVGTEWKRNRPVQNWVDVESCKYRSKYATGHKS